MLTFSSWAALRLPADLGAEDQGEWALALPRVALLAPGLAFGGAAGGGCPVGLGSQVLRAASRCWVGSLLLLSTAPFSDGWCYCFCLAQELLADFCVALHLCQVSFNIPLQLCLGF